MKAEIAQTLNDKDEQFLPYTIEELNEGIKNIKLGKASGLYGITAEMLHHFGPKTREWLLQLFNTCITVHRIPKTWKKAKVVALLKPGKDPNSPKSYRPISLLCTLYKLYELLIMTRISSAVDEQLSQDHSSGLITRVEDFVVKIEQIW